MKPSRIDMALAVVVLVSFSLIAGPVLADLLQGETLKFFQAPLDNGATNLPPGATLPAGTVPSPFPGHDGSSTAYYIGGGSYSGSFQADDFCDYQSTPIVHVMWWGSYSNNYYGSGVQQFLISVETDVASNAPGNYMGFSHPGSNIVSQIVTLGPLAPYSGTFTETQLAIPPGPPNPDGNLYRYNAELSISVPEYSNQVEWIKIVALTTDPALNWGWHDRDYRIQDTLACTAPGLFPGESNVGSSTAPIWHFQDDAVKGQVTINLLQGTNVQQSGYATTSYKPQYDGTNTSKDLAFALYTLAPQPVPCEVPCETLKFYQAPLNDGAVVLPPGGTITPGSSPTPFPGHDELSTAYFNGGYYYGTYMADDFVDLQSTPIVHVVWWGSYMNGGYYGSTGVQQFLITFETDVPANSPTNSLGYSYPGNIIASQIVTKGPLTASSGTFIETPIPLGTAGPLNPDGNLFQYEAELATPVPEYSNQVEWIKIVALTSDQSLQWGWHDRDYGIRDPLASTPPWVVPGESNVGTSALPVWHCQDDAVTGQLFVQGTNIEQLSYNPTFYNMGNDGITNSKDLAFALYTPTPTLTYDQWQLKYFGCTACPQASGTNDYDGDGMNNTNEFLAGTDPTSASSSFRVVSIVRQGPGSNDVNITWTARPCHTYIVQLFPGLADGSYVSTNFTDIAASEIVTPSVGGGDIITNYVDVGGATNIPTRYYRVRLVQ